jgi:hypothetical protein
MGPCKPKTEGKITTLLPTAAADTAALGKHPKRKEA